MVATGIRAMPLAQDRFKAGFWSYVWRGTIVAAAAHFAVITAVRFDGVPDYGHAGGQALEQVELRDASAEFDVPPPPTRISRPAVPVMSNDMEFSADITIGEMNFAEAPPPPPPPPPTALAADPSEQPTFTPYEIRPMLLNAPEVQEALVRYYPPAFRAAGVGGVTVVWIYIDEAGVVRNTRVVMTSGHEELDAIAQRVIRESATFSPAYNRDQRVPVWIQMPVAFTTDRVRTAG